MKNILLVLWLLTAISFIHDGALAKSSKTPFCGVPILEKDPEACAKHYAVEDEYFKKNNYIYTIISNSPKLFPIILS